MVKLVASDLDGTLVDKNNYICNENISAIKLLNKKNIPFVICTGKTYSIAKAMCLNINANYGIFGNGNQIINLNENSEIYRKLLTYEQINICLDIAEKNNLHFHLYTDNSIVSKELNYMDLRNYKLKEINQNDSLNFEIIKDFRNYIIKNKPEIYKLVISGISIPETIKKELLEMSNFSILHIKKVGKYIDKIINKEYEYIDIMAGDTNKDISLNFICNKLNINKSDVMAIGDNLNDLEMVKNSGIGIAVANSYDELKSISSYITQSNASEGAFAEAISKFIV